MDRKTPSSIPAQALSAESPAEPSPETPLTRSAAAWVQQFARTVKTCRLYDPANPTVTTFRRELAIALDEHLEVHGSLQLGFGPEAIRVDDQPIYVARTREDNVALPFFQDGIRALTLSPGIPAREVEALIDAVLRATRRDGDDTDLVTLLWEAEADHLSIEYIATDADIDSGGAEPSGVSAPSLPEWPQQGPDGPSVAGVRRVAGAGQFAGQGAVHEIELLGRSDDRLTSGDVGALEASLVGLEVVADDERERLGKEHEVERAETPTRAALELIRLGLAVARPGDRIELLEFLPRVLHETVSQGLWAEASACLEVMRDGGANRTLEAEFLREVEPPTTPTSQRAWAALDRQNGAQHEEFLRFAVELGPECVEWLMHGLAGSNRQSFRRALAGTVARLAADNPERLAPWLSHDQWYVVRNVAHILGVIGGEPVAGMLRAVSRHPEFRVRREAVASLARVPLAFSRPTLVQMLADADTRLYGAILHQLSGATDPELAAMLLAMVEDSGFESRPDEEQRAVMNALAAVGDDSVLPALEARIFQGSWFGRGRDETRVAAAMCVARLGTPAAFRLLEHGAASRKPEIARACTPALAVFRPRAARPA